MSHSESPSITNFFKPQRKRPRGSIGKEDVTMSASKKVLLEEGIIGSQGGGSISGEDPEFVKPKLVVVPAAEKPVSSEKTVKTEKAKKKTTSKTRQTTKSKEVHKISAYVKSVKAASSKDGDEKVGEEDNKDSEPPPSGQPPVESKTTVKEKKDEPAVVNEPPLKDAVHEPVVVKVPPVQNEAHEPAVVKDTPQNDPEQEPVASSSTAVSSNVSASPVKFLKVASLSPSKRKMMTSEQVARLLKKKTKLSELKSALAGINQCSEKLTEFRRTVAEKSARMSPAKPQSVEKVSTPSASKGMSPVQFYSPTPADSLKADIERHSATKNPSPSKFINVNNKIRKRLFDEQGSPYETKEKKTPAYQRFHALAQKTSAEKEPTEAVELPLPYNLKILKELFGAVDTVLGIMKGRKETILFPKVKAGVLQLFKTVNLRERHLAQMVTVLPNCYQFELEKVGKEYQYKISVEELLPSVICARRKAFQANLLKICLEEHQKFLLGLVPPIIVPTDKQITRWHPQFKLDEIDIIPLENAMPLKPAPDKVSTAREVMAKAQNLLESNPRMKQAMKNMLISEQQGKQSSTADKPKSAATMKALKGVSASLLDKIRNREREKMLNEMTRSPTESKNLQMAKRLPKYIKVIRNLMLVEKKVALPIGTLVERVSHSIPDKTEAETEAHLRLLATLLPKWAKVVKISGSNVEYLRIDMKTDINNLLMEMDDIIKKST